MRQYLDQNLYGAILLLKNDQQMRFFNQVVLHGQWRCVLKFDQGFPREVEDALYQQLRGEGSW